jgi:Fic family protein
MVVNNYRAMQALLDLAGGSLSIDHLLQIHATLGDQALDAADAAGRLRTAREVVRVEDAVSGEVWFTPPPATELPERLAALLTFANASSAASPPPSPFIHPLVRAIVLHFWLAYLHPFVDGNGRMARALFYWQMLRSGYDFAQYLSISGPIDRAPRAYYLAFAHSETDGGDLTYFLLHQLQVLHRATDDLISHLRDRAQRLQSLTAAVIQGAVNDRQRAILERLLREPQEGITIAQHARDQHVSYLTARKDLQELESAGHLRRVRVGRGHRCHPVPGLAARLLPEG